MAKVAQKTENDILEQPIVIPKKKKLNHCDPYPKPPTRRRTAYAYFVSEYYHRYRRHLGTHDPAKIHHDLRQHFQRHLTLDEKYRYAELSKKDIERYKDEWTEWKANFEGKRIPRVLRKRKNPLLPKQTRNAYIFYQRDVLPIIRRESADLPYREVVALIGISWKNLTEAEKEPYQRRSDEDKVRYRREKLQYRMERMKRLAENVQIRQIIRLAELKRHKLQEKLGLDQEIGQEHELTTF